MLGQEETTQDGQKAGGPEQVAESFIQIYNATLNGRRLSETAARKAAKLPDYIRLAAEDSAQRDLARAGQTASHGPEEGNGEKALYRPEQTDMPRFPALEEYDGEIKIVEQFSPTQYVIKLEPPVISGTTKHFLGNLATRPDRIGLTVDKAQSIIKSSRLALWQPQNRTIKILPDTGYVVVNIKRELVTAVPEKLRKKYRDYLEGK